MGQPLPPPRPTPSPAPSLPPKDSDIAAADPAPAPKRNHNIGAWLLGLLVAIVVATSVWVALFEESDDEATGADATERAAATASLPTTVIDGSVVPVVRRGQVEEGWSAHEAVCDPIVEIVEFAPNVDQGASEALDQMRSDIGGAVRTSADTIIDRPAVAEQTPGTVSELLATYSSDMDARAVEAWGSDFEARCEDWELALVGADE